jgi:uncharacterized protein
MKLQDYERVEVIDCIRGLALVGILFINAPYFVDGGGGSLTIGDFPSLNAWLASAYKILISGKFFTIFSVLFGLSTYIFLSNAERRGDRYVARFLIRSAVLFVIGEIHSRLWTTDIIGTYVVMGLFLLPLYKASVAFLRAAVWMCICLVVAAHALDANDIAGVEYSRVVAGLAFKFLPFLVGFFLGKTSFFQQLPTKMQGIRNCALLLGMAFIAIVAGYVLLSRSGIPAAEEIDGFISFTSYPIAAFYVLGMILLLQKPAILRLASPVSMMGRMSLTHYLTQDQWGALFITSVFGLAYILPMHVPLIVVSVLATQMLLGAVWLRFFRQGPVERILHLATYGVRLPDARHGVR